MDKIEKIRQEIERRIEAIPSLFLTSVEASANYQLSNILKSLLAFIDSLEKPTCELVDDTTDFQGLNAQAICNDYKGNCKNCPHNLKKESAIDELEEEVKNYFQGYWPGTDTPEQCNTDLHFTPLAILRLIRHFAEWQYQKDRGEFAKIKAKTWCEGFDAHKEQMMKDAVRGDISYEREGPCLISWLNRDTELKDGQQVKVIIFK